MRVIPAHACTYSSAGPVGPVQDLLERLLPPGPVRGGLLVPGQAGAALVFPDRGVQDRDRLGEGDGHVGIGGGLAGGLGGFAFEFDQPLGGGVRLGGREPGQVVGERRVAAAGAAELGAGARVDLLVDRVVRLALDDLAGGEAEGLGSGSLAGRLDEITGVGECNARVIIAELGTDPSVFPTPGHAAAWARLTPRSRQSGETAKPGRTGKGNRYLRGALGQAAMTAARTDTRLGALYRRIARKRGKQKAIVAVSRVICEIAWILICDPAARYQELGPDYYSPRSPARQTRDKIREIERLNPGKKVILADAGPAAPEAA